MKIALFGYGKMGKEAEQIALQRKHEIILKIDVNNTDTVTRDDLKKCDAAIEFTTPATARANMLKCFDAGIPVVVGTTGWYAQLEEVRKICKEKNGCLFYASNFSIGVNIFFKVNEYLSKIMNRYDDYDVTLEEIHHKHKLDAPSGTAITLANQIIGNVARKKKWIASSPNPSPMGEGSITSLQTKPEELEIISKREKEIPGTHIVKYSSPVDDIEMIHKAHNRKGFALGAVLAAEFVKGKQGIFTMSEMLEGWNVGRME